MEIHSMQILLVKFQDKDLILNNLNSFREATLWPIINSIDRTQWQTKIKCQTYRIKIRITTKTNKWEMTSDHIQAWIKIIKTNSNINRINSTGNRLNRCPQEDLWESQEPSNYLINQLRSLSSVVVTTCPLVLNKTISSSRWIQVWTRCKIRDLISNRTLIKIKDTARTRTTITWTSWIKTTWITWGRTSMIISLSTTTWWTWIKWMTAKTTSTTRLTTITRCRPRTCHNKITSSTK